MKSTAQTQQTHLFATPKRRSDATHTNAPLSLFKLKNLPGLPAPERRLYAFELTPVSSTRVIILGQDPYHTPGKANGLAFGISPDWEGVRLRSSFLSIFQELPPLYPIGPSPFNKWATLEGWAKQGVLLTNTRLSVEAGQPLSHAGIGWEEYVQREVAERILETNPLLVAFGAEARKFYEKTLKVYEIPADKVTLLCYSHPCKYSCSRGSKYAAAFKDSRCFDKINRALEDRGQSAIDWWRF